MDFIVGAGCGLLGLFVILGVISAKLRWEFKRELKTKPTNELEYIVYKYEHEYFRYIGEYNESVKQFKLLIEKRDLNGLLRNWSKLSKSFMKLESAVGYIGRPLIFEYYHWCDLFLKELKRRIG